MVRNWTFGSRLSDVPHGSRRGEAEAKVKCEQGYSEYYPRVQSYYIRSTMDHIQFADEWL